MKSGMFLTIWTGAISLTLIASSPALAQQKGARDGNATRPSANAVPGAATPAEPALANPGNANANREARQAPPGNVNEPRRQADTGRNEDWRSQWSDGHWWYWGPDNRWSYWNDGRWIEYQEPGQGSVGDQSTQTVPQGYGGDGCGCGGATSACSGGCGCSSGCASECTSGCGEQCGGCCHRHHHHRHRRSCC